MTHGYTRQFIVFSVSLLFGAAGTFACHAVTSDPIEDRSVPGGDGDGDGDGGGGGGGGCTRTQGYWKNHNSLAKNIKQKVPWPSMFGSETTELCGETWLEILQNAPEGDPWYIAAHQWIAAQLNVASGASVPSDVDTAIELLTAELDDCDVEYEVKAQVLAKAQLLDAYNNGEVGPGHCGDTERYTR